MAELSNNNPIQQEDSSGFDYRKLWSIIVLNWYWLIFSTLFFVALAYVYLRYQTPVYQAYTKVLIKDENGGFGGASANSTLENFGVVTANNGFENELEILSSTAVATRAVTDLKLYVTYTMEGRIRKADLYKTSPVIVDLEENRLRDLDNIITIEMERKGEGLSADFIIGEEGEGEKFHRDIDQLPCSVTTAYGDIIFSQNPGFDMPDNKLTAVIYPPVMMGRMYSAAISIQPTSKMTSVAMVSINDNNVERAKDYLTQLIEAYNADANEDKNEVARKTEEFIAERIDVIGQELDSTEIHLENFKRNNELVNLPSDANQAITQSADFQNRQVEIQTQMNLISSLMDYMRANFQQVIPANLGIKDQATNKMITDYNDKLLTRNRLLRASSEQSPVVAQMTEEVQDLWNAVAQQLASIYQSYKIEKNSADQQYERFSNRVTSTPAQERILNNIGRQQEIKAGLYLMLLQKREENYITLNSTATRARVIDAPQVVGKVSPRSGIIMTGAVLVGLFLPLIIFYLMEMLRFRINGRDDLNKLTKLSILADIPLTEKLSDGMRAIVVKENFNNLMEEAFRGLRTNLRFVLGPDEKVICCTSCVPGEGKTFITTNLAMSLALLGKRVIVLGLDIRKPRLVKLFGLSTSQKGITTYLAGSTADFDVLDEQIVHGVINPNLDVLPAGLIPPNPGELITRNLLDQAIEHLKTVYDFILIDTPPVGLVSDTYEIGRLADVTFFVVRSEYSTKADIEIINRAAEAHKLPKINIVFNGVDLTKRKYGFYYGYGKYGRYSKYGTYYGRYGHYGSYGHYGDVKSHVEK